jgi:aspartate/methionine/tyrosine aminotransferase
MDYETPKFFRVMQYAARADRDVVDMVSGNPDWEPPQALREALAEYAEVDSSQYQYPPSEGLRGLREEIASRRDVDVDRVVVTNGAGEANHLAMAEGLQQKGGNEVILTDPVYPYYFGRTGLLGGSKEFVAVEHDGQLDPAAVRERASDETALIVVNSPNNPTGAVYPESTIEELVAIAEAVDALFVCDEVYDHFDYSGDFASALQFDSPNCVVTNSFSKSMAITGFRVGYAIVPEWLVDHVKTRHMLTNVTGSRPAQYAVMHALKETSPEYYAESRARMRERIDTFTDALAAVGADYTVPDGSFYVMASFDGFPGTMDNVQRLIDEAGVAGMPGNAFGSARTKWLRFALMTPRVDEAATRLADCFDAES